MQAGLPVLCVFVFDRRILDQCAADDRRVGFIWQTIAQLKQELMAAGSDLYCLVGDPVEEIPRLAAQLDAADVYANMDYEPDARLRDTAVATRLAEQGRALHLSKDQVIFECNEVLTGSGKPYTVFTPYKNAWLKKLSTTAISAYAIDDLPSRLYPLDATPLPTLAELGFGDVHLEELKLAAGPCGAAQLFADFAQRIRWYKEWRDFPATKGVSYLSTHLRFGTISIRKLVQFAWYDGSEGALCWLNELIWREFYQQLLWHFPDVARQSFKAEYRDLAYPNNQDWFDAWCAGQTGYPLVDAAMRQLNQSGYMHNRLRMIAASFLVKDLLIDWRWGERYFADQLLDFDLAANNGGWQWAASTGCDAQPYFRIFNPVTQSQKFDPEGKFIRRYVPELSALDNKSIHAPWMARQLPLGFALGRDYPQPIVDHAVQREKALALFGKTPA